MGFAGTLFTGSPNMYGSKKEIKMKPLSTIIMNIISFTEK